MKIAWFTPFNRESAIGRYSAQVVDALIDSGLDVTVFAYKAKDDSNYVPHVTQARIVFYDDNFNVTILNDYLCVYNIGDNCDYHGAILDIMQQRSGIEVIHDAYLINLYNGYFHLKKDKEEAKRIFGKDKDRIVSNITSLSKEQLELLVDNINDELNSKVTHNALAVVVHSHNHERIIRKSYDGLIQVIPLLYECASETTGKKPVDYKHLKVLTVGNVIPTKCIAQVIAAIGIADENEVIEYNICGSDSNKQYIGSLKRLIDYIGLNKQIHILGKMSDDQLNELMLEADVVVNLRQPILEGASASLIESMHYGNATIVCDDGVYGEAPDDAVIKIQTKHMVEDLSLVLKRIINGEINIESIRENAKKYVSQNNSKQKYVESFTSIVNKVISDVNEKNYEEKESEHIMNALDRCFPVASCLQGTGTLEQIAAEAEFLFGAKEK